MAEREPITGPFVLWENYGAEGWHPRNTATLEQALELRDASTQPAIITRLVRLEYREVRDDEDAELGSSKRSSPEAGK